MVKLAYITSRFPKTTETFILNEVKSMTEFGHDTKVYSLLNHSQHTHKDVLDLEKITRRPDNYLVDALSGISYWMRRKPLTVIGLAWLLFKELAASPKILLKSFLMFPRFLSIAKSCHQEQVDHIHCGFANFPATAGLIIHKLTSIGFSITGHANDIFRTKGLLKEKAQHCQRFYVISEYNFRYLKEIVAPEDLNKIQVVRAGANTEAFSFRKNTPPQQPVRIICVASFVEKKGQKHLIDAIHTLTQKGQSIQCDLIGDGPLREILEKQVADLALSDAVTFHGSLPQNKVQKFLEMANIFVLPCVQSSDGVMDGIPVAIMEAMGSGVPVVTTDVSGIPELVIHGVTGLVATPGDAQDLANKIEQLVSDDALRTKIVPAANSLVREEYNAQVNYRQKATGIAELCV